MTEISSRLGAAPTRLRRDRWSLEVRGDEVADIAVDGVIVVRAVRPVVRDQDWNTVPVSVLAQDAGADGSSLTTELRFEAGEIAYRGTVTVTLDDEGLLVDFEGRAETTFARNRIGLVVLHPATDAGRGVTVRHSGGGVERGQWPTAISPHQPFVDVTGFAWDQRGVHLTMTLSGDIFETEDQRNWTDASFKTYSTPLSLPFPVTVEAGATCSQQVRLTAVGPAASPPAPTPATVTVSDVVVGTVPPVSLGASLYPPPTQPSPPPAAYEAVLLELAGTEARWPELVATATTQADGLGAALDVRVVTADPEAVERALGLLPLSRVVRLAAFDPSSHLSTAPLWTALTSAARHRDFTGQLLAGTRAHFTELNRQFDHLPADAPALTFSLTPQMHATEIPHIVDSLATQTTVAENALRLAGGRPVHVGPITLARRFNAVATTGPADPATDAARAVDPLLGTDFAAAWTLGSVAALARTGIAGLTYFETSGLRGVRSEDQSRPVGRLLDDLAQLRDQPVLAVTAPAGTAALAVRQRDGGIRLLVANLTDAEQTITVSLPGETDQALDLGPWAVGGTGAAPD